MKKLMTAIAVAGMVVAQSASALNLLNDTLTWSSGGIVATPNWNNSGTWLSWSISQNSSTLVWSYRYVWHTDGKDLSHFNMQVSAGATINEFWNWSFSHPLESGDPTISTFSPGPGNPGMPGSIYALQMNLDADTPVFGFSFDTLRAPVWGDFYAKDGKVAGSDTIAYNAGFLTEPDVNDGRHIAVPNGPGIIIVPDGGLTLGLMGLSLLGLGHLRRRFRG